MSDTSNPGSRAFPTNAQQFGVLEGAELLVTSTAANQRSDVGIRRTDGVREFRSDRMLTGMVARIMRCRTRATVGRSPRTPALLETANESQ
jgi:hypothetical protein